MELTRQQKIEVIKYAIDQIRCRFSTYMCVVIEEGYSTLEGCEYEDCSCAVERIPELLAYKPLNTISMSGWFRDDDEGRDKRISILSEILEELQYEKGIK